MKILVKVKPNSKESRVQKMDDAAFSVWVSEPAQEGKANDAVIEVLARHFGVARQNVKILVGHHSKNKIINIIGL